MIFNLNRLYFHFHFIVFNNIKIYRLFNFGFKKFNFELLLLLIFSIKTSNQNTILINML